MRPIFPVKIFFEKFYIKLSNFLSIVKKALKKEKKGKKLNLSHQKTTKNRKIISQSAVRLFLNLARRADTLYKYNRALLHTTTTFSQIIQKEQAKNTLWLYTTTRPA
jgi:hypothetical protein